MSKETLKRYLSIGNDTTDATPLVPAVFRQGGWQEVRLLEKTKTGKNNIVGSLRNFAKVPDGSMDGIYINRVLVTLEYDEVVPCLQECKRVLKAGAPLIIRVPDAQMLSAFIAEGRQSEALLKTDDGDTLTAQQLMFGGGLKTDHVLPCRSGYTALTLGRLLKASGLGDLRVQREWVDLWGIGRNVSAEELKQSGRIMVNNTRMEGPQKQTLPGWYLHRLKIELTPVGSMVDGIEREPLLWKPLGLGLKKP